MAEMPAVNANDSMKGLTIQCRIRGIGTLRMRMKIAVVLLKVAARVMGSNAEIHFDGGYPPLQNPLPPPPERST